MSKVQAAEVEAAGQATMATYVVGFVLSVLLTLVAFWLVGRHLISGATALFAIFSLALIQFCVQVLCFLHLGEDKRPRYKIMAFLFMVLVVVILAGGSLWIMNNLNYHMHVLTPSEQAKYLHNNEGI
jgi:cytochrome o ubiquinol oxidase operon protein cyoD